ncbi:putative fluoride ion transporter CrcB [Allostella humosa]|uniref:fluoride efflux transporter CrcB n=1 Tax=Stella humosa TaxID=94 RepID=UPI0011351DFC|nr:fluoride efflux transporter CrcB [Stella humosa]BBK29801.1 putative fluoride ion transporter CrcB [Stella humosa]
MNLASLRLFGGGFPCGTLVVNVVGSLTMGLLVGWFAHKADPGQAWRLFLTTGVLGGFTTFSTFSLDAVLLYERGQVGTAALYVAASAVLAIGGLFLGMLAVRHLA